jgi:hypothetical protein
VSAGERAILLESARAWGHRTIGDYLKQMCKAKGLWPVEDIAREDDLRIPRQDAEARAHVERLAAQGVAVQSAYRFSTSVPIWENIETPKTWDWENFAYRLTHRRTRTNTTTTIVQ